MEIIAATAVRFGKGLPSKTDVVNRSAGSGEESRITAELLLEAGYEEGSVGEV